MESVSSNGDSRAYPATCPIVASRGEFARLSNADPRLTKLDTGEETKSPLDGFWRINLRIGFGKETTEILDRTKAKEALIAKIKEMFITKIETSRVSETFKKRLVGVVEQNYLDDIPSQLKRMIDVEMAKDRSKSMDEEYGALLRSLRLKR